MIKLWTWAPLERTHSKHKTWDELMLTLDGILDRYEINMNVCIHDYNDRAQRQNDKLQSLALRMPLKPEVDLTPDQIMTMITVFGDDMNQALRTRLHGSADRHNIKMAFSAGRVA